MIYILPYLKIGASEHINSYYSYSINTWILVFAGMTNQAGMTRLDDKRVSSFTTPYPPFMGGEQIFTSPD